MITYSLTGSLATGGEATSFTASLFQDNIIVDGSTTVSLVIPSGQETSLSASSLIQSTGNSVVTLVANSASSIVYQDTSISVVKVD